MANSGYETVGGTRLSTNRAIHYRIQATASGDITSIFGYLDTNGVTVNITGAIYDSSAQDLTGTPSDRLALATPASLNAATGVGEWVELVFGTPYTVTSGDYIHGTIGTDSAGNWGIYYDDNNSDNDSVESTAASNTSLGDPADISGVNTDWDASIYVVIDDGGGTQEVTPNNVTSEEQLFEPTITTGVVSLVPDFIASSEEVFEPTVTVGAFIIAPDFILSSEVVNNITISVGGVSVTPDFIPSGESVENPTITVGTVLITPGFITSTEVVQEPAITVGSVTIAPNFISSEESVQEPVVGSGTVVQADFISSGEQLFEPTITTGATNISVDFINTTEDVFNPFISGGEVPTKVYRTFAQYITNYPGLSREALADKTKEFLELQGYEVGAMNYSKLLWLSSLYPSSDSKSLNDLFRLWSDDNLAE